MIKDQDPNQVKGIWCRSNKTFYYLETGSLRVRHPVDRLKKMLTTRGLLTQKLGDFKLGATPFKIFTLAEAQERGDTIEVLYLNAHVRSICQTVEDEPRLKGDLNPWGK